MTRIIAVANQKGGVGKTTTSVNVAASLAMSGGRVLLIDLDPQGNATMGCGIDKNGVDATIYEWLIEDQPLEQVVQHCNGGFDVLPANLDLTAAEVQLMQAERREYVMRDRLRPQEPVAVLADEALSMSKTSACGSEDAAPGKLFQLTVPASPAAPSTGDPAPSGSSAPKLILMLAPVGVA